jgi:hypothetical protein
MPQHSADSSTMIEKATITLAQLLMRPGADS